MDRPYLVRWNLGELTVHAASAKEAMEIALEYLRNSQFILTSLIEPQEPSQ